MGDLLGIAPVAAVAYFATNLDNFTVLVSLLARYRQNTTAVAAGFVASAALLCLAAYALGEAAEFAPVEYLGFLGFIPITVGTVWLIRLVRDRGVVDDAEAADPGGESTAFAVTLTTQLGNGTDTVITLGVLFADSMPSADTVIFLTLLAMVVLFVLAAIYGVNHPALGRWIDRYAPRIAPFIMIAVGAYILFNTATDVLPD